jgi:hypothetical protein
MSNKQKLILKDLKGVIALLMLLTVQVATVKDENVRTYLVGLVEYLTQNLLKFETTIQEDGQVKVDFTTTDKDQQGNNSREIILKMFEEEIAVILAMRQLIGQGEEFMDEMLKAQRDFDRDLKRKEKELEEREKALAKREKEEKKGKFKVGSHFKDQQLKYNYPLSKQAPLFDILNSDTIKDIEVAGVERSEIVEGIKLSSSETKVIDCLCKLLHDNSQTLDQKKEDYYSGNIGYDLIDYGGDKNTIAPKLAFTLYELTKEYKGGEYVAGKDIENVQKILTELNSKRFLIKYTETTKGKKGEWIKKEYEAFRRLIDVDLATLSYGVGDIENYKKTETVIVLNPIFRRQIDTKFILYPNDINRRTIIAYGSHNISEATLRLRDYLMRELSSKRYNPEIGVDRLYHFLSEKWMKESRKKKVKEYTEKALETVTALGLLLSYEIKPASTGEPKIVFTLNKEWE